MKGYIYSEQIPLFGHTEVIGFGCEKIAVKEIERDLANSIIQENHYSGKFYAASYIHLGVFIENEILGVLQFGYAMNPGSQASVVRETKQTDYLELNRMWLDDRCAKNTESASISRALKYIRKKHPNVEWIQSFADERCGKLGVVYQAANFKYYGEHTAIFWELDGAVYHNSLMTRDRSLSPAAAIIQDGADRATKHIYRQFRYLYFLHKGAESRCLLSQQPYPKPNKSAA